MSANLPITVVSCIQCGRTVASKNDAVLETSERLCREGWDLAVKGFKRGNGWCPECIAKAFADTNPDVLADIEISAVPEPPNRWKAACLLRKPHAVLRYWKMPKTDFAVVFIAGLQPLPERSFVYLKQNAAGSVEVAYSRTPGKVRDEHVWFTVERVFQMVPPYAWDRKWKSVCSLSCVSLAFTLSGISGLLDDAAYKLIQRFGSLGALCRASVEEISEIQGISKDTSEDIMRALQGDIPGFADILKRVGRVRRRRFNDIDETPTK